MSYEILKNIIPAGAAGLAFTWELCGSTFECENPRLSDGIRAGLFAVGATFLFKQAYYLIKWGWQHVDLFDPTIISNLRNENFLNTCHQLNLQDLLNKANCMALSKAAREHVCALVAAFHSLKGADTLNEENRTTITAHPRYAWQLAYAIVHLHEANILNDENRTTITVHPNAAVLFAPAIISLHEAGILNEENRATITAHPQDVRPLIDALILLHKAGMLNEENRTTITDHPREAYQLAKAIILLHKAGLLNEENRTTITASPDLAEKLAALLIVADNHGVRNGPCGIIMEFAYNIPTC